MSKIQVKGTQLEYIEQGEGDPVVLVHGTLGDYRSWQLQMDAFAGSYRTIAYSRRYHYPNACDVTESDYSAILHADDLAGFIAGLGLDAAHVVGTSYGAYTALFLAARHPGRVRKLVLGDPPVFSLIGHLLEGRELRDEFMRKVWEPAGDMMRLGKPVDGIKMFVDGVVSYGTYELFSPEVRQLLLDNACEFTVEASSPDFWTTFTCEDAKKITTPTLLLTGDNSKKMFQLIVDELSSCLPNNQSLRVPETTHELPSDNPDAFNRIVLDFLSDD